MMKTLYDANELYEHMEKQTVNAICIIVAATNPYPVKKLVQIGYMLLEFIGVFINECKLLRQRLTITKTYNKMKINFSDAHQNFNLTKQQENNVSLIPQVLLAPLNQAMNLFYN